MNLILLMYRRVFAFLLVMLGTVNLLYSQTDSTALAAPQNEITIKGRILDEVNSETLPGTTITIKGTEVSAVVDSNGYFELITSEPPPLILVISSVGYKQQEYTYNGETEPIEVKLVSDKTEEPVVIIGYGKQRKKDVTGAVASVPTELKSQPVSSAEKLLQGSVSGVQVTQSSGQPGSGNTVQIRGMNSITAGNEPLYVVDGFPIYNDDASNDAGVASGTKINPLSLLSPSDIESIDVLKDASATAIYGSRGANGVIIITTKKGSKKPSISYDGYVGQQSVIKTIDLMNAKEWGQLRNDALVNSGKSKQFTDAQLDSLGEGTDWQSAAFRKALIQNHSLSILGGSDKTRVALSGNYFKQDGVVINTGFKRYSARLNVEHDYSKRIKLGAYLTGSLTKANISPQSVVPAILLMPPSVPVYNANGSYVLRNTFEGIYGNPINTLNNQINESNSNRVLGSAYVEYKIIDGLTFKILGGTDIINNRQNRYLPSTVYEGSGYSGLAQVGAISTINWLNENTLNYAKKIGRHNINAIIGHAQQESNSNISIAGATGFATDEFTYNNLGAGTSTSVNAGGFAPSPYSSTSRWALQSGLGRINYGYNDKYLITATLRADGSSRFADGHKWGFFPSGAVAWNVSSEDFMSSIQKISQLKLRFSAGVTGNQQIPPYQSISQLGYYRYNFSNTTVSGFAPNSIANPDLTWEKTAQYDLGIDLGLFNNRITLVADVYYKKTHDLLLNVTVPATSGLTNFVINPVTGTLTTPPPQVYRNFGAVENKGVEFAVNSKNLVGNFKWNTTLIFSHNRNKILSLGDGVKQIIPDNSLPSIAAVGRPIGSFIVYETNGLIPAGTPAASALTPSADKNPGAQQYKDINGDGKITQAGDRVIISNQPKFIAGITNNFSFKGFDLLVFFQTSYGNKLYNQNRATLELGTGYTNASTTLLDRWTPTNTDTDVHRAYQDPAAVISNRFIEDASYLRLKTLTLGYTLPKSVLTKTPISNLRVYVSAQNIWTLTKYTGFDPEVNSNGQSAINMGVDNGAYPNSKTLLTGLSFSF